MNRNCANCVSWKKIPTELYTGHCKKNPPTVIPRIRTFSADVITDEELANGVTVWPITREDDCCGKHFHKNGKDHA